MGRFPKSLTRDSDMGPRYPDGQSRGRKDTTPSGDPLRGCVARSGSRQIPSGPAW